MEENPNIKKNIEYLLLFARFSQLDKVKLFIEERNVDVNSANYMGCTALHAAALRGNDAIVEYLLSKDANVDAKTVHDKATLSGATPLAYAVKQGYVSTAKILLEHGAKTDIMIDECSLLSISVGTNNADMVNLLLDNGADINDDRGYDGRTPLCFALFSGKYQSARFILDKGADYRKCCHEGFFPLIYATQKKEDSEGVELLLKHVEAKEGKEKLLEYINYNGANNGRTALHGACMSKNYHATKVLLEHGADYNIKDKEGSKPYDLIVGSSFVCKEIRYLFQLYAATDLAKSQGK